MRHHHRINEFIGAVDREPMNLQNDRPIRMAIDQNYRFRRSLNYQSEYQQQAEKE